MFNCFNQNKIIHFIGIGGIGMSGIAEILHSLGFTIQGSDMKQSANTDRLLKLGIDVFIGHKEQNITNADIVVYSSAIKEENVELIKAQELRIPCLTRAEILSQIVRFKQSIVIAGSHGKTTVTALCANLLERANLNPTIINGGIINAYGSNAKLGTGNWAVIESDESDGSFTKLFPTIAIITNIDQEHLYYYKSFDNLKHAFSVFLQNLPFYGVGLACIDDPVVRELVSNTTDREIITYGLSTDADIHIENIEYNQDASVFSIKINNKIEHVSLPLFGQHNIKNALAAISLSKVLKLDWEITKLVLEEFTGIKRRFNILGKINNTIVIDDYAHHPTEIAATIEATKQKCPGKLIVVHQPHRFKRLNQLFDKFCTCFNDANAIILTPVYIADDADNGELNSNDLYKALLSAGKNVFYAHDEQELMNLLKEISNEYEAILFTGAGSISQWAHNLVNNWK